MISPENELFEGQLIDDHTEISIVQLCRICSVESDMVERLIDEGVIEPSRRDAGTLYFRSNCLRRTRVVTRLRNDLGVNLAGAALALELLDRIETLQARVRMLDTNARHNRE